MQIQKYKTANAKDAKKIQIAADIRLVLCKVQFKLDWCFAGIVPVIQYKLKIQKHYYKKYKKMQKLEITAATRLVLYRCGNS